VRVGGPERLFARQERGVVDVGRRVGRVDHEDELLAFAVGAQVRNHGGLVTEHGDRETAERALEGLETVARHVLRGGDAGAPLHADHARAAPVGAAVTGRSAGRRRRGVDGIGHAPSPGKLRTATPAAPPAPRRRPRG
jgi:hypothetical protein